MAAISSATAASAAIMPMAAKMQPARTLRLSARSLLISGTVFLSGVVGTGYLWVVVRSLVPCWLGRASGAGRPPIGLRVCGSEDFVSEVFGDLFDQFFKAMLLHGRNADCLLVALAGEDDGAVADA